MNLRYLDTHFNKIMNKMEENPVVKHLKSLRYIGAFPHGTIALLVPVGTAVTEGKVIDPNLTAPVLKNLCKAENVMIFTTLEDYARYKGLKK